MSILEVQGLEAGYEDLQILWGIDLAVEPGTLTALAEPTGRGRPP